MTTHRLLLMTLLAGAVACTGAGERSVESADAGVASDGGTMDMLDAGSTDAGAPLDAGGAPIDGGPADGGPPDGGLPDAGSGLGQTCARNSDCPSGLCLPGEATDGVCTHACQPGASDCLAGWSCATFSGVEGAICQCAPTAEVCDGLDNDCDGVVDESAEADAACVNEHGEGYLCRAGGCTNTACASNGDCLLGQVCDVATGECLQNWPILRVCLVNDLTGGVVPASCYPGAALPPTVAFGLIQPGMTAHREVRVFNDGAQPLVLNGANLSSMPPGLTLADGPVSLSLNHGESMDLALSFTAGEQPSLATTLALPSNDPTHATVQVPITASVPVCSFSGTDLTPVAAIVVKDGTRIVDPTSETFLQRQLVTLDGATSTSAAMGGVTAYRWRLVSQPEGSMLSIPGMGSAVYFMPALPGEYVVELVALNDNGCRSAPATVTVRVSPSTAAVQVQLTWPEAYGDVDLHYIGPGGSIYQTSPTVGDLDWNYSLASASGPVTPTPRPGATIRDFWGLNNTCAPNGRTSDDASFDVDQLRGYGPEIVTHNRPFDGVYKVAVHYYCNGSGTTTTPHIAIYVNGVVAWEASSPAAMNSHWVWDAAQIVVSNNGTTIEVVPLTTPLYRIVQGC